jgi:hypothetical protein
MIMLAHDIDIIGVTLHSKAGFHEKRRTKAFEWAFFGIPLLQL